MKTIALTITAIMGGILGIGFGVYAFLGFVSWLLSDPFDWIEDTPKYEYVEPKEFQLCREKGGIPIRSAWNGELKRCDSLPLDNL